MLSGDVWCYPGFFEELLKSGTTSKIYRKYIAIDIFSRSEYNLIETKNINIIW